MQQGRGSVGSHKHGVSGHAPRSPRYKLRQTLEDNKRRAEACKRKPRSQMVRIPTKPAMHSNLKPATCSDAKPAGIPI